MLKKYVVSSLFLLLVLTLSFPISSFSNDKTGCNKETPRITLDNTVENNFDLEKSNGLVLLEGTCSQLKSGACGTGTCEKGWKCMDTGIQCICSPPQ